MSTTRSQTNAYPPPAGEAAPPNIVTQTELAEYFDLERRWRELGVRREQLRASIMDRLRRGHSVDEGAYTVRLREIVSRQFTRARLEAVLGPSTVADLRNRIEPSVAYQVIVERTHG